MFDKGNHKIICNGIYIRVGNLGDGHAPRQQRLTLHHVLAKAFQQRHRVLVGIHNVVYHDLFLIEPCSRIFFILKDLYH